MPPRPTRDRISSGAACRLQKLSAMLVEHLDGLLNHCRTPVRFGMVEAINGNIKGN
jgi:transposase